MNKEAIQALNEIIEEFGDFISSCNYYINIATHNYVNSSNDMKKSEGSFGSKENDDDSQFFFSNSSFAYDTTNPNGSFPVGGKSVNYSDAKNELINFLNIEYKAVFVDALEQFDKFVKKIFSVYAFNKQDIIYGNDFSKRTFEEIKNMTVWGSKEAGVRV